MDASHATTPAAAVAGEALKQQWPGAYTDAAGHVWVPLKVPVGVAGSGMIARVRGAGRGSDRGDPSRTGVIGYGIRSA